MEATRTVKEVRMTLSLSRKLDVELQTAVQKAHINGSFDLHVYQLLLLWAFHEPLRQRSGCVRVDDHPVI
jgi:hypothetical protein